jgi:regulator of sirC expression with transglutaminase-like and TPR domain
MSDARSRFAALVAPGVERIPLAEAALWIAKADYPDLDVESYLDRFDELAEAARDRVAGTALEQTVARFNEFVFGELRFAGNNDSYADPRNSYLNEVLDRRVGIPISLSLVYTEIGRRLGLPVVGVGFPGHFLVKWIAEDEVLVDPFHCKVITREDCAERLRSNYGPALRFDESMLAPAEPRQILARSLRNLKHNHLAAGDLERALGAVDRILLVTPDDAGELRDRGLLYLRLECFAAALGDLEKFLERAPYDPMAGEIRARLPALRESAERVQ